MTKLTFQDVQKMGEWVSRFNRIESTLVTLEMIAKAEYGQLDVYFNGYPFYNDSASPREMPRELKKKIIDVTLDFWRDELAKLSDTLAAYEVDTERAEVAVNDSMCQNEPYTIRVDPNCVLTTLRLGGDVGTLRVADNPQGFEADTPQNGAVEETRENKFWRATQDMAHR